MFVSGAPRLRVRRRWPVLVIGIAIGVALTFIHLPAVGSIHDATAPNAVGYPTAPPLPYCKVPRS